MVVKTNSPSALDAVLRILSSRGISCTKRSNNEAEVTGKEGDIRTILQEKLDEDKFDFANDQVLVDGTFVWSYNRISKELSKIKKSGTTAGISKYFYTFMHMNFTTVQYNINGWSEHYPTWPAVKSLFNDANCPAWKTDVKRILDHANRL